MKPVFWSRTAFTLAWLAVLSVCTWAYWPGLSGPSMLDDYANLKTLEQLEERPDFAADVVLGNHSGPLGRPLSMLSFTVEKLFFDGGLYGTKRTNLLIHLLTGSLLWAWITLLLRHAGMGRAPALALLAAGVWLLAPLFVSTVLYTVQRMAQLSALFSLVTLLLYSHARCRQLGGYTAWPIFALVPVAALAAVLAKENGILALPLVWLLEGFWFQFRSADKGSSVVLQRFFWSGLVLGTVAIAVVFGFFPERLMGGYQARDFDLLQRCLTEARILWEYLWLLLTSDPATLGVVHDDYRVSDGLLAPASTLGSVSAWLALVLALPLAWPRGEWRRLWFGPAFYLLGHSIESTVLPLELYFEHRNYLPSMGVLAAAALGLGMVLRNRTPLVAPVTVLLVIVLGRSAFILGSQAYIWSSEPLRVMTDLNAHPDSPRANISYAVLLAEYGAVDEALERSARAGNLAMDEHLGTVALRNLLLICLAGDSPGVDQLEAVVFREGDASSSDVNSMLPSLFKMLQTRRCPDFDRQGLAIQLADQFLDTDQPARASGRMLSALAQFENDLQRIEVAYRYNEILLQREPDNKLGLFMHLYFATILEHHERAKAVKKALLEMESAGQLSVQERENLDLFDAQ